MTKQAEDKILQIRDEMNSLRKKVNDIEYKLNVSDRVYYNVYVCMYSFVCIYIIYLCIPSACTYTLSNTYTTSP